jgi:hypothetical protein
MNSETPRWRKSRPPLRIPYFACLRQSADEAGCVQFAVWVGKFWVRFWRPEVAEWPTVPMTLPRVTRSEMLRSGRECLAQDGFQSWEY